VHDRTAVEAFYGDEPRCGSHTDTNGSPTASVCEPNPDARNPLSIRSWPLPIRRRRPRDPVRRGLDLRVAGVGPHSEIVLTAPRLQISGWRGGHEPPNQVRKALVWQALLAAHAIRSRAEIARWQGVSRARITQVMRLLLHERSDAQTSRWAGRKTTTLSKTTVMPPDILERRTASSIESPRVGTRTPTLSESGSGQTLALSIHGWARPPTSTTMPNVPSGLALLGQTPRRPTSTALKNRPRIVPQVV
jgi:hypothetical protein